MARHDGSIPSATPTAHATTHGTVGADTVSLVSIGAASSSAFVSHTGSASAHHARYTDGEADARVAAGTSADTAAVDGTAAATVAAGAAAGATALQPGDVGPLQLSGAVPTGFAGTLMAAYHPTERTGLGTDESGRGNAIAANGTVHFTAAGGLRGLLCAIGGGDLRSAGAVADVAITGALTVLLLVTPRRVTGAAQVLATYRKASGSGEDHNCLWQLGISGATQQWLSYWEQGAGSAGVVWDTTVAPADNAIQLVALTRGAAGATALLLNGHSAASTSLTMPTGGGSADMRLVIGQNPDGGASTARSIIHGVEVWSGQMSAAQVLEIAQGLGLA